MRACVATCDQLLPCADRRAANGVDAASVPARAAVRMTARRCALKCARFADLPMSHVGEAESARNRRISSCRSLVRRITCRAAAQETRARLLCEKMTEIVRKQRNQLRGDPEPPHFRGSPTSLEAISASVSVARQMSLVRTCAEAKSRDSAHAVPHAPRIKAKSRRDLMQLVLSVACSCQIDC